ncbi:hypothetical protein HK096_005027, partial [Nowakowskiella sp. JEL0078]
MADEESPLLGQSRLGATSPASPLILKPTYIALSVIFIFSLATTLFLLEVYGLAWNEVPDARLFQRLPNISCTTRECVLAAADLLNGIDEKIDPCEIAVKEFLSNQNPPKSRLNSSDDLINQQNFRTIQDFYNSCVKTPESVDILSDFIKTFATLSTFPVGIAEFPSSHKRILTKNLTTTMANSHKLMTKDGPFFKWDIVPESRPEGDVRGKLFRISPSNLEMPIEKYSDLTIIRAFESAVSNQLRLMNFRNLAGVGKLVSREGADISAKRISLVESKLAGLQLKNLAHSQEM